MVRRGGHARRIMRPTIQCVAVIFGLKRDTGEIVRISVYEQKDGMRLSGPHGPHSVHSSNLGSIDGWRREAALVWGLTDVYDVSPQYQHGEHEQQLYAELQAKSAERKRQLADYKPEAVLRPQR